MSSENSLIAALHAWTEIFMRRSMRHVLRYSKESGLSMSQIVTLFRVQKAHSSVSDLGEALGISNAAASQMLERLVQQDLILRSEDPHDRRVKQIVLTDKGCQALRDSIQARQGWLDGLASALTPVEREQVTAALNVLIERAGQLDMEPAELP
jgi:DNA-binding MarR family transcriptional regulator